MKTWEKISLVLLILAGVLWTVKADAQELGNFYMEQCYKILGEETCPRTQFVLAGLSTSADVVTYDNGTYKVRLNKPLWKSPRYLRQYSMYEWQVAIVHELCHVKVGPHRGHDRKWQRCARRHNIALDAETYAD